MAKDVDYQMDPSGLRQIGASADMQDAMVQAAEAGRMWAEANSPRVTGEYADNFQVEPVLVPTGWSRELRGGAELANTAPHGSSVERRNRVLRDARDVIVKAL